MKVLILTDDFPPKSGGGAAMIAGIHARALCNHGHDVIVVTTVQNQKDAGQFKEKGIRVVRIYSKYNLRFRSYLSLHNPFISTQIKEVLQKEKPDIVHAHNIHQYLSYYSLALSKKYAKAVFITIHDSMPFHYSKLFPQFSYEVPIKSYKVSLLRQLKDFRFRFNPFKNLIIRRYLRIPNKIFAVSFALKNALADNGIKNVEVIHNGIDSAQWTIDLQFVNDFKKEHNLFDKKVIMFCGRLSRAKGGDVLVRSMPEILKQVPNAILLVVGEKDTEASEMLKYAQKLGIDTSLVFTGKLAGKGIIQAYGASDILVTPSLCFDWFPTVNLEGMAMKLPVVATCFGGSPEEVSDGITGHIINPYHEQELVNNVVDVLKNSEKAERFGQAGYDRVVREFSIKRYAENTLSWYNKFL